MSRPWAAAGVFLLCMTACNRWSPPTDLHQRLANSQPMTAPAQLTSRPVGPLWGDAPVTLGAALETAWANHPAMRQRRQEIGVKHGRGIQADLWPNPVATTEYMNEPSSKRTAMIMLAQKFELGGKRDARVSAAAAETFLAETALRQTWAAVRANVKESFLRLAYLRRRHAVLEQLAAYESQRLALSAGLLKAGKVTETQHLAVEQSSDRAAATAAAEAVVLTDARRQVFAAIGGPDPAAGGKTTEVTCSLAVDSPSADRFEDVLALARRNSPALATAQAGRAVAQAQLRLARARAWSDLTVGVGYKLSDYETGDRTHAAIVGVGLDLPIWDRKQGDIKAALAGIDAAGAADDLASLDVAAAVSDLWSTYKAAGERAQVLQHKVLPAADRRVELTRQTESAGKASRLDLLDRQRETQQIRLDLLGQQLQLGVAAIQLEKLTATLPTNAR